MKKWNEEGALYSHPYVTFSTQMTSPNWEGASQSQGSVLQIASHETILKTTTKRAEKCKNIVCVLVACKCVNFRSKQCNELHPLKVVSSGLQFVCVYFSKAVLAGVTCPERESPGGGGGLLCALVSSTQSQLSNSGLSSSKTQA